MGERKSVKGNLDVRKSDNHVWTWKVGPSVAKSWDEGYGNSQSLGSVTVTVDTLDEEELNPKLEGDRPVKNKEKKRQKTTMKLPDIGDYSVDKGYLTGCLYIFSETSTGKVVINGIVHRKFEVKPIFQKNKKYFYNSKKQEPKLKVIGILPETNTSAPMLLNTHSRKASSVKTQQDKKVRMEKHKLESVLFDLFAKKSGWQLNELDAEIKQPREYLKQILEGICVRVKDRTKVIYELKPEYKTAMEED